MCWQWGDEYCVQIRAMLTLESDNSGLIKRELCQQRGISEKSFYYWLRKLRGQMAEATGPRLVPLDSAPVAEDMLQILRAKCQFKFRTEKLHQIR